MRGSELPNKKTSYSDLKMTHGSVFMRYGHLSMPTQARLAIRKKAWNLFLGLGIYLRKASCWKRALW